MTNSLIIKAPGLATIPGRPKVVRDPMIRPGTKFLYDFSRPACHPDGVITAGPMAGKTLVDLTDNAVPLTIPPAGWTANADGSISNGQGVSAASIGAVGQFDMAPAEYEYISTYWFSITAGYLDTNASPMLYLNSGGTNPTNAQLFMTMGGNGRKTAGYCMGVSSGISAGMPQLSLDEPHMLAAHVVPGSSISWYIDGALAWSLGGVPANFTSAAAASLLLGGGANRRSYRISLCDLAASRAAEEAAGYAPDAILTAPQHILREWRFCRGEIAAAPRDPFVA